MALFDNWSWRPGLPSLGPKLSIWFVDPSPVDKDLDEFMLVFLVEDGEPVELLANRAPKSVTLPPGSAVRKLEGEKEWTKFDGRRALVKRFKYLSNPNDVQDDADQQIPADWTEISLPPKQLSISQD